MVLPAHAGMIDPGASPRRPLDLDRSVRHRAHRSERRWSSVAPYPSPMELEFSGELWHWQGPSPFHFVTVPLEATGELRDAAAVASYGWGVVPVAVRIGDTDFTTSLFPKDGGYVVPIKDAVRRAEGLTLGDIVSVRLRIEV
jgi:hypothetical protein